MVKWQASGLGPNISKRWPVGERTVLVGKAFELAGTTAPERNNLKQPGEVREEDDRPLC